MGWTWRIYVGLVTRDYEPISEAEAFTAIHSELERQEICSATVTSATGIWGAGVEPSTVVEVWADHDISGSVRAVARRLKEKLNQACILVTRTECQGEVIQ